MTMKDSCPNTNQTRTDTASRSAIELQNLPGQKNQLKRTLEIQ